MPSVAHCAEALRCICSGAKSAHGTSDVDVSYTKRAQRESCSKAAYTPSIHPGGKPLPPKETLQAAGRISVVQILITHNNVSRYQG